MNIIQELKRRNVFKVAIAYLVVGWLAIQVIVNVTVPLSLPDWAPSLVIVLLAIGFPIALIFAWAFELTPDGIKKSKDVDQGSSISHLTSRKIDFIIIGALVLIIGGLVYERMTNKPSILPEDKISIAVLPFVNMSSDPEQEFFSDGITEEILNALVRVEGLKVTARTSAFAYKGQTPDLREVGKVLGVNNIVEGSVRKSGSKIRITAQLINTTDGSHIWSEVYDRELTDVFAIQDEIAKAIANTLTHSLGLKENKNLVEDRITNMEAYDKYLYARKLIRLRGSKNILEAFDLLNEVTTAEPNFAPGWAALSMTYHLIPYYSVEYSKREKLNPVYMQYMSEKTARRAVSLNPNLASAYHLLANALRWRRQWVGAEDAYRMARQLDPESVEIIEDYGEFLERVGHIKKALTLSTEGVNLDPASPFPYLRHLETLVLNRQYQQAIDKSLELLKEDSSINFLNYPLISSYIHTGKYHQALLLSEERQDVGLGHSQSIEILKSLRDGKSLEGFPDIDLLYDFNLGLLHLIGGDELVLNKIETTTFNNPGNHFIDSYNNLPFMDRIRKDIRYKQVVLQLGLVDYWRERGWPDYCEAISDYDFECGEFK
ncbi:MAG: hypothetical protein OEY96_09990 [Gammaproteobacteria bacterium]|nr:hypothetical protein [Gammaproteobacteria bacterium]